MERLRVLADMWAEEAHRDKMQERKQIWQALNDFAPIRPAILAETCLMTDYVTEEELLCQDEYLRNIERYMIENIRHAKEIGDDFVLEKYMRIPWDVCISSFGVDIKEKHATDMYGDKVACTFEHPIANKEDVANLRQRTFYINKQETIEKCQRLNEIFKGILPVQIGGIDPVYGSGGYSPFCGLLITEITLNLYKLIGMDNIYFWLYDNPKLFHKLMRFVTDDFIALHKFLEKENLLAYNSDNSLTGGRYGYCNEAIPKNPITLKDCWLWCNAEETTTISPEMYKEFILPYLKEGASLFGKIYFGCCENIESRWELIKGSIPNIKAVSTSPFSNVEAVGELLGDKYILSKKLQPAYLAQKEPDFANAKKDIQTTLKASKSGNVELILRDVYRVGANRKMFSEWVNLAKSLIN